MKRIYKVLFVSFSLFLLVACGKPDSQKALEKTMHGIQNESVEKLGEREKSFLAIIQKSTYTIEEVRENGNQSEIDMRINTVDLSNYIAEYIQFMLPMAFLYGNQHLVAEREAKFFEDLSNRSDLKYVEIPFTVYLEKKGDTWFIVNEQELFNNLFGGLDKGFEEAVQRFFIESFMEIGKAFWN